MERDKDIFKWLIYKIPSHIRITFIVGMVTGLLSHMYILTRKLPMWDDLNSFYSNGMSKVLARWMLDYIDWFSGMWSVPWINGFLTILFISIGTCFIVAALHLKSVTSAVLVPVMMMTFPTVFSTLGFTFTTDSYAFGIMLACVAAYCIRKWKYGFIPGIICMCMSMGCYQAYLPLAAAVLVLGYILDLYTQEQKTGKDIFLDGIKTIISLGFSVVTYISFANYLYPNMPGNNGVDEMGKIDIVRFPRLIGRAYKRILEYFLTDPMSFVETEMYIFNVISVILCILLAILLIWATRIYLDKVKLGLLVVLGVLYPMVLSAIYIMAPDAHVSMLMLYPYCMVYITIIAFTECFSKCILQDRIGNVSNILKQSIILVSTVVILFVAHSNFVLGNEAYFRSSIAYERVKDYYSRIISRVEAMEGYQYGDPLLIWGEFVVLSEYNTNPLSVGFRIDDAKFEEFSGIALEQGMMTSGGRDNFLRIYLGVDMKSVRGEKEEEIVSGNEFKNMAIYPAEGSIKQIDGVWVVKLNSGWEVYQEEYLQRAGKNQ